MDRQLKLVMLSGLLWASVSLDMGVISFSLKGVLREFSPPVHMGALLASSTLIGMLIGAVSAGHLGDRFGRRRAALFYSVLHSAATIAGSLSPMSEVLVVDRILVGVGLGGVLPLVSSLVSELSSVERRGRNVAFLESFWAWGWLVAVLIAWLVAGPYGWRWYMASAGAVALLFNLPLAVIPESPRFLLAAGRPSEAEKIAAKYGVTLPRVQEGRLSVPEQLRLLLSRRYLRVTLALWIVWFTITMGYYGIFIWFPKLVVDRGAELGLSEVAEYISANYYPYLVFVTLMQIPGYYSAVFLVDRVGRKPVLSVYLVATALSSYFYAGASDVASFMLWAATLSFFDLGAWAALYVYTPEQYPTQARASGSGWAAAWGRVGGIIGPYLVPFLGGWYNVFTFFAAIHVVGGAAAALGREMRGEEMPELQP